MDLEKSNVVEATSPLVMLNEVLPCIVNSLYPLIATMPSS